MTEAQERMTTMEIFPRITMNPEVRSGKPRIAGAGGDVATIVGTLGTGDRVDDVDGGVPVHAAPGPGRGALCGPRARKGRRR